MMKKEQKTSLHQADRLQRPNAQRIQYILEVFWHQLGRLADLVQREEHLLSEQCTSQLRRLILEMMLALNGVQYPENTRHLNDYLGQSQREAIEKTLIAPTVHSHTWVARSVGLVVIYRWYAPQLVEKYNLTYPSKLEKSVWGELQQKISDWPETITTG